MSDELTYELDLRTADDNLVELNNVRVTFFDSSRNRLEGFNNVDFPPARRFQLPDVARGRLVFCEVMAPDFRLVTSTPIYIATGPKSEKVKLLRQPSSWKAVFTDWGDLGGGFMRLKDVLARSANIRVIGSSQTLPSLSEGAYDGVNTQLGRLAKSCLLNLYLKMSQDVEPVANEQAWFSFVDKILSIGRERFIAVVNEAMYEKVKYINQHDNEFDDYEYANAGLHTGNFPPGYTLSSIYSIKSDEDHGNIQLSAAKTKNTEGQTVFLLDADIDENGKLLPHAADLVKHKFNGGTHPYDIHEYLQLIHEEEPLGYTLERA